MTAKKFMPGGSDRHIRFRIIPVFDQEGFHGRLADRIPQVNNLIRDLLISPPGIVFLQSDNEVDDFLRKGRPTGDLRFLDPSYLRAIRSAVPPENRVGGKEFCTSLQQGRLTVCLGRHPFPLADSEPICLFCFS